LRGLGYELLLDISPEEAAGHIERLSPSLWVTHVNGDQSSDLSLVERVRRRQPELPCLVISQNPSVDQAVRAIKLGCSDYLPAHASEDRLWAVVEGLLELGPRRQRPFSSGDPSGHPEGSPIAHNPEMCKLLGIAKKIAPKSSSVLIQGESGSGKEVIARFIHENSDRKAGPFVAVNCAALPESLLESELFGHEKGAFTGAITRKKGKFELAHGGHLLLDEVSEMPQSLQAKLLRVLQEREIDRVGGLFPVPVDVRVIATANRDLEKAVASGDFRLDLYYRLNVVPLKVPPLRDRPEDILPLARHFLDKQARRNAVPPKRLSPEAEDRLRGMPWPGNVRELENLMERLTLLVESDVIRIADFSDAPGMPGAGKAGSGSAGLIPLREMERDMIFKALSQQGGNRTHAARVLGISVRTLRNKLHEYREELGEVAAGP
jgi:two-component system response regulator FlrC